MLHHDFSFLSQVAFILRGLRRIFDLSWWTLRLRSGWRKQKNHCLKIKNLKTTSKHRSAPQAVRQKAQLAERCHSVFSLFFYVFNLRAGVKLVMRTIVVFRLFVLFGCIEIILKISCFWSCFFFFPWWTLRLRSGWRKQKNIHALLLFFCIHDPSLKGEQMK